VPQVHLTVNGRGYDVTCDEGQEAHLRALGTEVDERVRLLARQIGQVGEARLLLLAALLIADDLAQAKASPAGTTAGTTGRDAVAALDQGTRRVDALAARLQQS